MTDTTAQEPTMEEILASIRRIISEDDAPAAEGAPAAPEPAAAAPEPAEPEPTPPAMELMPAIEEAPAADEDEEILDLTDRYEAPASETIGDLDVAAAEPEPFPAAFAPEPDPVSHDPAPSESSVDYDALVSDATAASAASAFAGLTSSVRAPEPTPTGGTGPTIDDLARALLRPMLKEWLDANLPGIVETAVKKEVERISRSA
jgi:cell pole-organizing protein PopZ